MPSLSRRCELTPGARVCAQVMIIGAGPIGLRAACEMALLGHKVTVVEARSEVTRLNVIK